MALIYNPLTYFSFAVILSLPFAALSIFRLGLSVFFLLFMAPALLAPAVRAFRRERPLAKILLPRDAN
jgi:hypothetical protein